MGKSTKRHKIPYGSKIGRLTLIKYAGRGRGVRSYVVCECECGSVVEKLYSNLRYGTVKSCGCYKKEINRTKGVIHGASRRGKTDKEYKVWSSMKQRCINPNNEYYKDYGDRGIGVCDRWDNSYGNFIDDIGKCPRGKSLDRIDNNKGYNPDNCRWASLKQQNFNKRNTIVLKGKTLDEWSKITGIKRGTLDTRYRKGWSFEDIISPLRSKRL